MNSSKYSLLFPILFLVTIFTVFVYAHDDGEKGRTRKSTSKQGCTCHGDNPDPSVRVVISGPDTLQPNMVATYTVTITGGPLKAAGVDIAASKGKLFPADSDLKIMAQDLTHKAPKKPVGNSVVFKFTYKSPFSIGKETLFANGNSVNGDDKKYGDKWNFAQDKSVVIVKSKLSEK